MRDFIWRVVGLTIGLLIYDKAIGPHMPWHDAEMKRDCSAWQQSNNPLTPTEEEK